ncbi:unnamed protein product, partial [Ilex paraguariensis]
ELDQPIDCRTGLSLNQKEQILYLLNMLKLIWTFFNELIEKFDERTEVDILENKLNAHLERLRRSVDEEVYDAEEKVASLKKDLKDIIKKTSDIWSKMCDNEVQQVEQSGGRSTRVDTVMSFSSARIDPFMVEKETLVGSNDEATNCIVLAISPADQDISTSDSYKACQRSWSYR